MAADAHAADVQAELQQYLNSKNINSLFISIVESLLIEKPANPIAFIIEYLYKQYPDHAKAALDSLSGGAAAAAPAASAADAAAPAPARAPAATADSDSEEEDEDDIADMPEMAPKPRPAGRRTSVSAESMDPAKMKAQMANVTCIEKEPEVYQSLMKTVSKSPLLRTLDAEQKDKIVKAFSGPLTKGPGEDVITQGDIGDVFYLLESGEVDVYVKKGDADELKVHTYKPGDAFGELAIMYNAPRAATCRASTDCKLWALDRVSFKVIVVAATMIKREMYEGFLEKVPILESLNPGERQTLADALAEEKYADGATICTQGEEGNYFYIVKEGEAVCSVVDGEGNSKDVATLTEGNYFGEIALMTAKPRQATVKARGNLVALALDRATFTRVLGNLDEIMKRNIDQYTKYTASSI